MKKKPEMPLPSDPLLTLLDEWRPDPEFSAQFDRRLRQRIQQLEAADGGRRARRWAWGPLGWSSLLPRAPFAAAGLSTVLLVTMGVFFYLSAGHSVAGPAPAQMAQMNPVFRDLQTLDRDSELLEHLDFLSAPSVDSGVAPRLQDQD